MFVLVVRKRNTMGEFRLINPLVVRKKERNGKFLSGSETLFLALVGSI